MKMVERVILCNQLAVMKALERIALPIHWPSRQETIDKLVNQIQCTEALLRDPAEDDAPKDGTP